MHSRWSVFGSCAQKMHPHWHGTYATEIVFYRFQAPVTQCHPLTWGRLGCHSLVAMQPTFACSIQDSVSTTQDAKQKWQGKRKNYLKSCWGNPSSCLNQKPFWQLTICFRLGSWGPEICQKTSCLQDACQLQLWPMSFPSTSTQSSVHTRLGKIMMFRKALPSTKGKNTN